MKVVVSLDVIVDAMDVPNIEWTSHLNRKTGEILTLSDEDRCIAEEPDMDDDLPEWQRELIPKFREVLDSDDWIALPDKFEIHEWSIMERFSMSREPVDVANKLLRAIHGSGAFRMFKATIYDMDIQEDWFQFRDETLKQIARNWCEEQEIKYK
ncbi:UPF0158 family protein [bacterium]|nr:UPF0158 family protein [bacterium]